MEKFIEFLKTDKGKLVGAVLGIVLVLAAIAAATPKCVNIVISGGDDAVVGIRSAKKTVKRKRKKDKKAKKAKKK